MKTAISIPEELFEAAERFARRVGVSRSALYAKAVERYLREHRHYRVTERLNEVYGDTDGEMDPEMFEMQLISIQSEEETP